MDHTRGHEVALKLLHPRFRMRSDGRERLGKEAEALASLDHPHVARAYAVDMDAEQPHLVMELVEGVGLDVDIGSRAGADRHYEDDELRRVLGQLCSAVSAAHAKGIIHRDLKPANVVVARRDGQLSVKILDFGLAKWLERDEPQTTQGRVLGSLSFMSPEQASGRPVDHRTDIFALGVLFFEMVTLRRVWARGEIGEPLRAYAEAVQPNPYNTPEGLAARIAADPRPTASRFRAGVRPEVDRLLERAMAIVPEDRFDAADAFLQALPDVLCDEFPPTMVSPAPAGPDGLDTTEVAPPPGEEPVAIPPTVIRPESVGTEQQGGMPTGTTVRTDPSDVPQPLLQSSQAVDRYVWPKRLLIVAAAVVALGLALLAGMWTAR